MSVRYSLYLCFTGTNVPILTPRTRQLFAATQMPVDGAIVLLQAVLRRVVVQVLSLLALLVQRYKYRRITPSTPAFSSAALRLVLSLLALQVQKYEY